MKAPEPKTGWFEIPNQIYHHDPAYRYVLTSTGMKHLNTTPFHWHNWRFTKPVPATAQQNFGSAYHLLFLQPDVFDKKVCVFAGVKRGKVWAEYQASIDDDAVVITPDEYDTLLDMHEALMQNDTARGMLQHKQAYMEQSGFFKPAGYNFYCSIRPDIRIPDLYMLGDLKTTGRSAEYKDFQRTIANYRYHWQAALYLMGATMIDQIHYQSFVWIVQEKFPPYAPRLYRATDSMVEVGTEKAMRLFARFAKCLETDTWRGYPPRIADIDLPLWAD